MKHGEGDDAVDHPRKAGSASSDAKNKHQYRALYESEDGVVKDLCDIEQEKTPGGIIVCWNVFFSPPEVAQLHIWKTIRLVGVRIEVSNLHMKKRGVSTTEHIAAGTMSQSSGMC